MNKFGLKGVDYLIFLNDFRILENSFFEMALKPAKCDPNGT